MLMALWYGNVSCICIITCGSGSPVVKHHHRWLLIAHSFTVPLYREVIGERAILEPRPLAIPSLTQTWGHIWTLFIIPLIDLSS